MAKLGEVCLINPKSCALRDDTEVSFVPMTKVGECGEFDASEIKHYSEVKKGFTNFQNDDILFAKITPCMENGKGAIAQNMKNGVGFGSTEFHVLRPDTDKITSEWLYYLTTWKTFRQEAERNMTGSAGQKRVPKTFLKNYVVNLPEIDTQKNESKILRKVDDLISLRKQQLAKLDELVKARFVEMFETRKYPIEKLGRVCEKITDGTHKTPTYLDSGIKFISAKNIIDGKVDLTDTKYISKNEYQEIQKRCQVEIQDILLTKSGTLGIPAIIRTDCALGLFESLAVIKYDRSKLLPYFLYEQLRCNRVQRQFKAGTKGVAVMHLHLGVISDIDIIVPPISYQLEFSDFAEQVDKQKQTVQQSLDKLELMKKALMQEYFG